MQYRSLTLQESFGLIPLQSFKEGKGMAVKTGSYEVGGKLPNSILIQKSTNLLMIPSPQATTAIAGDDLSQPRYDYFIIGGSIVLILGVSIIIYLEWEDRSAKKASTKMLLA